MAATISNIDSSIADGGGLDVLYDSDGNIVLTVVDAEESQGSGKIELGDNAFYGSANLVTQTVESWSDTKVIITVVLGSHGTGSIPSNLYLFLTNNSGSTSAGTEVLVRRQQYMVLVQSAFISSDDEATTERLTPPAGKTTGTDFNAGLIGPQPVKTLDLGNDKFSELGWVAELTSESESGQRYDVRAKESDGTELDSYDVAVASLERQSLTPAFSVFDRVRQTTSTTGTGTYDLDGTVQGFETFASVLSTDDETYYVVTNGVSWEIGRGKFTSGSTPTLSREEIIATSSGNSAITWGSGTKDIFVDIPAERRVLLDDDVRLIVESQQAQFRVREEDAVGTGASSEVGGFWGRSNSTALDGTVHSVFRMGIAFPTLEYSEPVLEFKGYGSVYFGPSRTLHAVNAAESVFVGGAGGDIRILQVPVEVVTASLTLDVQHSIVLCNNTTSMVVSLPTASDVRGRRYLVKRLSTSTASVTVNSVSLGTDEEIEVVSDGTSWYNVRQPSTAVAVPSVDPAMFGHRLSVSSSNPYPVNNTSGGTLYLLAAKSSLLALYNTSTSEWEEHDAASVSAAVPATTNTNYDVFVYDNSGTLALEFVAWTDSTTRATALVRQNGVYVKTGALDRRYAGTVRTGGTSGQIEYSTEEIFVWNMYNRAEIPLTKNGFSSHTYSTSTWRVWNNDTSNKAEFLLGVVEDGVHLGIAGQQSHSGGTAFLGLALNSTTSPISQPVYNSTSTAFRAGGYASNMASLQAGLNTTYPMQLSTASTGTFSSFYLEGMVRA